MWVHLIWFVACMVFSAGAAGVGRFLGLQDGREDSRAEHEQEIAEEREKAAVLRVQLDGAEFRAKLVLEVKNDWADRARRIEAQLEVERATILRLLMPVMYPGDGLLTIESIGDPPSVGAADREEMEARRSQAKPTPTLNRDDFSPVQIDDDEVPPVADITHDDGDDGADD